MNLFQHASVKFRWFVYFYFLNQFGKSNFDCPLCTCLSLDVGGSERAARGGSVIHMHAVFFFRRSYSGDGFLVLTVGNPIKTFTASTLICKVQMFGALPASWRFHSPCKVGCYNCVTWFSVLLPQFGKVQTQNFSFLLLQLCTGAAFLPGSLPLRSLMCRLLSLLPPTTFYKWDFFFLQISVEILSSAFLDFCKNLSLSDEYKSAVLTLSLGLGLITTSSTSYNRIWSKCWHRSETLLQDTYTVHDLSPFTEQ